MLVSKPDAILWSKWKTVTTAKALKTTDSGGYYRLFPPFERQGLEFRYAFDKVWDEGSWTVYIDEGYYLQHELGLEHTMVKHLTQGRSKHISVVVGMQRPFWINRFALSEPTHIFAFRLGDRRDLRAISEGISGELAAVVPKLDKFQFAYYNKDSEALKRGTAQTLVEVLK